jgi:arylsulfatase A-like enzyme
MSGPDAESSNDGSRRRRRRAVPLVALVVALAVAGGTYMVWAQRPSDADDRANIVMIVVDDLDQLITPHWDAMPRARELLAGKGTTFTNSFAPDPVCCPARATILAGKYAHNTGVYDNTPPDGGHETFKQRGEDDTIATRLRSAGYTTGFLGKYLNGYEEDPTHVPPGWSEWFGLAEGFYKGFDYTVNHNGTIESYGDAEADYQTDVISRQSERFVEEAEADDDRPFFLVVAPTVPHIPLPPAPRHTDHQWVGAPPPETPNFDEADVSDKPLWLRDGSPRVVGSTNDRANRRDFPNRMGSLLALDDMIVSIVDTLRSTGELDDTYIVFTSDNGYMLGSHRLLGKQVAYEESIRVPLVIVGPGVPTGADERYASQVDFAATFLDIAGAPLPDSYDGMSLLPLLQGEDPSWRDDVLIEYKSTDWPATLETMDQVRARLATGKQPVGIPTYAGLRTPEYLYVQWYRGPEHEYELYDLEADPYQLENLVATPQGATEWANVTEPLQARLDELKACAGARCRS